MIITNEAFADAALAGAICSIAVSFVVIQQSRFVGRRKTVFTFISSALLFLIAVFAMTDQPAARPVASFLAVAAVAVLISVIVLAFRNKGSALADHDGVAQQKEAYDVSTRAAGVTVFVQDGALQYRWINQPRFGFEDADAMVGLTDAEFIPAAEAATLTRIKKEVLETGAPASFEIEIVEEDEPVWFQVDITPFNRADGGVREIVGIATNISRLKRLDKLRTGLAKRLSENTQRFELALRSGDIHVFSQDRDFIYDWTSSEITPFGKIIGQSDSDIFSGEQLNQILNAKETCLEGRQSAKIEIRHENAGSEYWYDLSIEPIIAPDGAAVGLISSAVDVTERKTAEDHQTLLLRELTHRSKNLLTVIQAIAGQTARMADDTKSFVNAFNQRLRALGATQDLLVADNWGSVDLERLCAQQIEPLVKNFGQRLLVAGPHVGLSPEAAQALGLALHELATNALKYGAFSTEGGSVAITWVVAGDRFRLKWAETGGPPVCPPSTRGFGRVVIENNLAASLSANVEVVFQLSGVVATVDAPIARLVHTPRSHECSA